MLWFSLLLRQRGKVHSVRLKGRHRRGSASMSISRQPDINTRPPLSLVEACFVALGLAALPLIESSSGIFVFESVDGLWGRGAEIAILYLYGKALILASELICPCRLEETKGLHIGARGVLECGIGAVEHVNYGRVLGIV